CFAFISTARVLPSSTLFPYTTLFRSKARTGVRVTMLVRCLAMMRGGGETRHLAWARELRSLGVNVDVIAGRPLLLRRPRYPIERSEEHTSELQSRVDLVCRLLLEKKK